MKTRKLTLNGALPRLKQLALLNGLTLSNYQHLRICINMIKA